MTGDASIRRQHVCAALGAAAAFALFVACSKGKEASDTTSAAKAADTSGTRNCDGSKPTSNMKARYSSMSKEDLDTYLHSVGFDCKVDHESRKCRKDQNKCKNPDTDRTDIQVAAAQKSNSIGKPDGANKVITLDPGTNGYVVARFVNDGSSNEDWLNLAPNDTAYWIIEPDGSGNVESRYIEGKTVGGIWSTTSLLGPIAGFAGCQRGGTHAEQAAFADCESEPYAPGPHPMDGSTQEVTSTWISCVAGCCTTNGVRLPKGEADTARKSAKRSPST